MIDIITTLKKLENENENKVDFSYHFEFKGFTSLQEIGNQLEQILIRFSNENMAILKQELNDFFTSHPYRYIFNIEIDNISKALLDFNSREERQEPLLSKKQFKSLAEQIPIVKIRGGSVYIDLITGILFLSIFVACIYFIADQIRKLEIDDKRNSEIDAKRIALEALVEYHDRFKSLEFSNNANRTNNFESDYRGPQ